MFDAAAAATAAEVASEQVAQEQAEAAVSSDAPPESESQESSDSEQLLQALSTYMPGESSTEIVFVDPSVPDYQTLLAGMDPNVEVVMLDGNRDGIEQMASALAGRTGIDAIHLIAAGNDAQLHLGTSSLTQDSLSTTYAQQFQQIGQSLSANADLLIYGSNFGNGDAGQAAMQTLAQLTGADVAASTDRTGSAAEYGNWQLEVSTGSIETAVVIGASTQETWAHVLTTAPSETADHLLVAPDSPTTARQELVFVDTAVEDYQGLLAGISPNAEVIILDSTKDGVQQISEALQGRTNIDAIHILSHGVDGALEFGATWLNSFSLEARADAVAQWGQSLSADADILLYGCNVAENAEGRAFVNRLAELTGADVAASTDLTGYALFGGDWDLEYRTGSIETEDAADLDTQHDWAGLMSVAVDATSTGSGSSVTSVTVSHTTTSASDRLLLVGVSMDSTGGRTVSSVTYAGQSLTLVGTQSGGANPVRVEIWRLVNPPSGTANVVVGLSGTTDGVSVGATTFTGVDQTTPLGTFASAIGTSASPSVNVASASGELVYDVVAGKDATTLTQGTGQTELWELANSGGDQRGAVSTEAGAATVTMSWSKTTSGTAEWAIGAVSIKAANVAPTITSLSGDSLAYNEGDGAVVLEQGGNALVADVDSTDFNTGTLTVSFTAGSDSAEDVLAIRNQGTGAGQIGVSGANVTYQGVTIGTFTGGSSGTNLVITFNVSATPTAVTALVKNTTFQDTDTGAPTTGARTVRYVLTDGDGGTSANYDTTVTVSAVNDAPVLDNSGVMIFTSITEDDTNNSGQTVASIIASAGGDRITDVDSGASEGIAITSLTSGSGTWQYNTGSGWTNVGTVSESSALLLRATDSIRFVPDGEGADSGSISFRAWDQASGSAGSKVATGTTGTVTDQFNSASFSNNNGTQNWAGAWIETDAGGVGVSAGSIQISSNQLRFDADTVGDNIAREVDLSNTAGATLTFSYNNTLTGADRIEVRVSSNGGANYTTLTNGTFSGSLQTGSGSASFDISAYASSNTRIQFIVTGTGGNDRFYVDNVQVSSSSISATGAFSSATETASITVTAANDAPTDLALSANTVAENAANGTVVGTISGTDPDSGDTKSYSFTDSAGGRFAINSSTGQITVANGSLLNYESATSHTVTVRVTDSGGLTYDETFTINLTNVNETPTDLALSANTVAENAANGTVVGAVSGTDPDTGDTKTYSFTDSAGGRFAINSSTGQITVADGSLLNYESATSHTVTVRVTDSGGLTYDETFTINLTNVNETPTDLALSANTVAENAANGTVVGAVSGTDPDTGDTKSYSFTDSAGGRFAINSSTGQITVADGSLLNYESATSHSVTVRVTDSGGLTYDETFTINLTNVNEAPTGADATVTINEDTSHTLTTANFGFSDVDAGDSLSAVRIDSLPGAGTLKLSGVAVTAGQVISAANISAGNLVFTPADNANGTGYASFTFSVRDGNSTYDTAPNTLTLNVTAVNDAPTISSLTGDTQNYTEGAGAVIIEQGYDSWVQDVDSANFDTGALTISIPSGGDSAEDVLSIRHQGTAGGQIGVSGSNVTYQGTTIGTFTGGTSGSPLVVTFNSNATVTAVDALVLNITYRNTDTDSPTTGARTVRFALTDGDGGTSANYDTTVTVSGVNDAPTDLALSANTVAENAANGTVVGTVSGTDVDAGDTKAYSLTDTAGGRFMIDSATGIITVADGTLLNYESATSHNVTVQVTDSGGLTYDEAFTINLTNVNEAPTGADATVTISEDTSHILTTANFGFSDVDAGDSLSAVRIDTLPGSGTLTLSGVAVTAGQVVTVANITAGNLVFTPAADANGTGYATLTFSVRDSNNAYDAAPNSLTVDVTAVNDAPTRTAGTVSNLMVSEDAGLASLGLGSVTYSPAGGADESGQTLTYAVTAIPSPSVGDVFLADGTTRVTVGSYSLADIQGMQFKPAGNASGVTAFQFNVYDSGGTANGGADNISQFILITVNAGNDAPTITNLSGDSLSYSEGDGVVVIEQSGNALVADVDSTNLDTGTLTVSIPAGGDSAEDVLSIQNQGTGAGQIGVSGANISYEGVTIGTFTGGSSGSNLVITFNSSATPTAVTALVKNITYENTDTAAPTTGARTVRYSLTDGDGGTSSNYDTTVTVSALNDAPVVMFGEGDKNFTEGALAVMIDVLPNVSDLDSTNFDTGTLTITISANPSVDDRVELLNTGMGAGQIGVSGTNVYYGGTLIGTQAGGIGAVPFVVTFNANADASIVGEVMANIRFWVAGDAPSTATRTVEALLTDGDGGTSLTASKQITVTAVNDAPTITNLSGDSLAYSEGAGAVVIEQSGNALVADVDSANFDTGTLTVSIPAGGDSAEDVLSIQNQGTGAGQIGVSGSNITYGGVTIGTFTGGSGGSDLVIALNSSADATAVTALIKNITYENTDTASPTIGARTVRYILTDGDGGTSADYDTTVTVAGANDAPVNTVPGAQSVAEDAPLALSGISVNDVDGNLSTVQVAVGNGTLNVTLAGGVTISAGSTGTNSLTLSGSQGDINATLASLTYQGTTNYNGPDTLTITSTDSNSVSDVDTVALTVTAANDAPTLAANTGSTVAEGGSDTMTSGELSVIDVDNTAAQLTFSIGSGPASGRLELTTVPGVSATTFTQADIIANRLVYVHDGSETTSDSFTFTVNDGAGGTVGSTTVTLTITPVNDAPTIVSGGGGAIASVTVAENVTAITVVTGADVDVPAQTLAYGISGGADQALFTIDTATGALSFVAPPDFEVATDANGDNVYVVQVRVVDSQGAAVTQTIQVTVTDVAEGASPGPVTPLLPSSLIPTASPSLPLPAPAPSAPSPAAPGPPEAMLPGRSAPIPTVVPLSVQGPLATSRDGTPTRPVFKPEELRPMEEASRAQAQSRWDEMLAPGSFSIIPVEAAGPLTSGEPESSSSVSDVLMSKLDAMATSLEQAIGADEAQHALEVRVVSLAGTTLSVGFVAWALRSSWFLASCLATLPAWKSFDPLPVVSMNRRERDRYQQDADTSQRQEQAEFDGLQGLFDSEPPLKPNASSSDK